MYYCLGARPSDPGVAHAAHRGMQPVTVAGEGRAADLVIESSGDWTIE